MAETVREAPSLGIDVTAEEQAQSTPLRRMLVILALEAALLFAALLLLYNSAFIETAGATVELSTVGQLMTWVAGQSEEREPEALLAQIAKGWASGQGQESLSTEAALGFARGVLTVLLGLAVTLAAATLLTQWKWAGIARRCLIALLILLVVLLFILPPAQPGYPGLGLALIGILLALAALLLTSQRASKFVGVVVIIAALLLTWEALKAFGSATNFQIGLPQAGWVYRTYPDAVSTLLALQNGEVEAVIVDGNEVEDLTPAFPDEGDATGAFGNLRRLPTLDGDQFSGPFEIRPAMPGRYVVVVRAEEAGTITRFDQITPRSIGTIADGQAAERFLNQPRSLVLVDLRITNDLNMPHLQNIAGALLQPARRNGPVLLTRILGESALVTWGEALMGFVAGGLLGFLLGTVYAHSKLLERGCLPYVVASQTVPILAVAPMVVIALGSGPVAVAVISAYLTFFPVTINTLRGLTSPKPTALELMRSYAATPWEVMWKLRFPAALPYIFTALKVSATASIVGAIIGELPSGVAGGLGRAILNFNQYYTSDPAKLWAAIVIAALLGIAFFLIVSLVERMVLRGKAQEA
jgi:NitT/TauT family transport system permease protein